MRHRDGRRAALIRGSMSLSVAALLVGLAATSILAQGETIIVPVDFKTIGLQGLTSFDPSLLYRPVDMMSTRPGGQAAGMGGAFTASANGVVALGWNPAGLATLERTSLSVDGVSVSTSGLVGEYPDSFNVPQSPPLLITSYDVNLKGSFNANYIAVGTPLLERGAFRAVGGLAWRRFMNLAFPEETIGEFSFQAANGFPVILSLDRSEKGAVDAVTPGVACQIGSRLAVGASFNFLDGTWRANGDNRLTVVGPPYRGTMRCKIRYSGAVPEFGVRLTPAAQIQLAARYMPSFDLKARDGDYYARGIPFPTLPVSVITAKIADYDLSVPSSFSVGLAVRPMARLLVAADLNSQKWSEAKATYKESVTELFADQNGDLPLADVQTIAFGAEYILKEFDWASIPVRAGFHSAPQGFLQPSVKDIGTGAVPTPYGDQTIPVSNGEFHGTEVEGTAYTFGFSILTKGIRYDLGVESVSYTFDKWLFDSPFDQLSNPRGVKVSNDRSVRTLRLSASYDF